VRCAASRHFKNKKKEYLRDKINALATRTRTTVTGIEEYMNLRAANNLGENK
jgi:hypothetical protein